jgi:hypothetical protein
MRPAILLPLAATVMLTACAGRASGPPPMAYGLPDPPAATYEVADSITINSPSTSVSLTPAAAQATSA